MGFTYLLVPALGGAFFFAKVAAMEVPPLTVVLGRVWIAALLLVTFLIPISAILPGTIFLGERLSGYHFFRMLMIGCGLCV